MNEIFLLDRNKAYNHLLFLDSAAKELREIEVNNSTAFPIYTNQIDSLINIVNTYIIYNQDLGRPWTADYAEFVDDFMRTKHTDKRCEETGLPWPYKSKYTYYTRKYPGAAWEEASYLKYLCKKIDDELFD